MSRHSRGVSLIAARSWALIFSFASILSFFSSHNSNALSIDPILDGILPVVKRDPSDSTQKASPDTASKNKNDKASDSASSNTPPQTESQIPGDGSAPDSAIVAEPLMELPTLETSDTLAQSIRSSQPLHIAPSFSSVLGVSDDKKTIAPVQATSQGWMFFGVAWYWWLVAGVVGYYTTRRFAAPHLRKLLRQST